MEWVEQIVGRYYVQQRQVIEDPDLIEESRAYAIRCWIEDVHRQGWAPRTMTPGSAILAPPEHRGKRNYWWAWWYVYGRVELPVGAVPTTPEATAPAEPADPPPFPVRIWCFTCERYHASMAEWGLGCTQCAQVTLMPKESGVPSAYLPTPTTPAKPALPLPNAVETEITE